MPIAKKSKKTIVIMAAMILLLIFFHYAGISSVPESGLIRFMRPISGNLYMAGSYFRRVYDTQTSKKDLAAELTAMREKTDSLISENARFKILEEENKSLRQYLNFLSKSKYNYVMANVISRGGMDADKSGQTLLIDKGLEDGLKAGLAVVSGDGVLVGKIMDVKDSLAEVCLASNPRCKIAATIQNEDKTSGIAEGDLGLTVKMNFIPQTKVIKTGDVIVTSGLDGNIPRGLVIGTVAEVVKENNELWQSATIEPLLESNELVIVSALLPN